MIIHNGGGRAQEDRSRTPYIFHGPASLMHLVLLGNATTHKMHVARPVTLHLQCARLERPLLADEDMKVVIGGVEAPMAHPPQVRGKDERVNERARAYSFPLAHPPAAHDGSTLP